MPAQVGVAYVDIKPELRGFDNALRRGIDPAIDNTGRRISSGFGNVFRNVAVTAGTALAGVGIARGLQSAITAAGNLAESQNKVNVIFGKSAKVINEFAKNAAVNLGISNQEALDLAGSFGNLFRQLGIGEDQTTAFTQQMGILAADLASFHNVDPTEVIIGLTAAFRGEYDSVQRFVPTINAATVEHKALEQTGKSLGKELTATDKAIATHTLLMEGAGAAAGDFERTSGGAANQQRILSANWKDLTATLGGLLLPAFSDFIGFLNDRVIPGVRDLIAIFRDEGLGGAIGEIGDRLADAAPEVLAGLGSILTGIGNWFTDTLAPWLLTNTPKIIDFLGTIVAKGFAAGLELIDQISSWVDNEFRPFLQEHIPKLPEFIVGSAQAINDAANALIDGIERWANEGGAQRFGESIGRIVGDALRDPQTIASILGAMVYAWGVVMIQLPANLGAAIVIAAGRIIGGFVQGLQDSVGEIDNFFVRFGARILLALVSLPLFMWDLARRMLLGGSPGFLTGLVSALPQVLLFFITLPLRIIGILGRLVGDLFALAIRALGDFLRGVRIGADRVFAFVAGIPGDIVRLIGAGASKLLAVGKDLAGELLRGLKDALLSGIKSIPGALAGALPGPLGAAFRAVGSAFGGEAGKKVGQSLADVGGDPAAAGRGGAAGILAYAASTPVVEKASSVFRKGSITRSGNVSYHGLGRAVDFVGPNLMAIFQSFLPIAGTLKELIYSGAPFNIKNGRRVPRYAVSDHWDHVHVALEEGGLVKHRPGGVVANIGEGRYDEMVIPLSPEVLSQVGGRGGVENVNLFVTNPMPTGRDVVEELEWHYRTSGV